VKDEKEYQQTCCAAEPSKPDDVYVLLRTSNGLSFTWSFENEYEASREIARVTREIYRNSLKLNRAYDSEIVIKMTPITWR